MPNDLEKLLDSDASEQDIHEFLERSPAVLTGAMHVMAGAVVSKLKLGADYIPDFAYVNPQSGRTHLHLIEIEDPAKPIFTQDDHFSHQFNKAYQQVEDWLEWCGRRHLELSELFKPLLDSTRERVGFYSPICTLIYGRRSELSNARRRERWAQKTHSSQFIKVRTYDGLCEEMKQFIPPNGVGYDLVKCFTYKARSFAPKVFA